MRVGDNGKDVAKLQEFINRWEFAYDIGLDPLLEDGAFGPVTESHVRRFQNWADLEDDGVADPITISSLITVVKVKEAYG